MLIRSGLVGSLGEPERGSRWKAGLYSCTRITIKVTEGRGGCVLTEMHAEPNLRKKRSHKILSKKSELCGPYPKPTQVVK